MKLLTTSYIHMPLITWFRLLWLSPGHDNFIRWEWAVAKCSYCPQTLGGIIMQTILYQSLVYLCWSLGTSTVGPEDFETLWSQQRILCESWSVCCISAKCSKGICIDPFFPARPGISLTFLVLWMDVAYAGGWIISLLICIVLGSSRSLQSYWRSTNQQFGQEFIWVVSYLHDYVYYLLLLFLFHLDAINIIVFLG